MMCEAVTLGYGTRWLGGYDTDAVRRKLNIPDRFVISSTIAIGRTVGDGKPKAKAPLSEVIRHNGFQV